MRRDSPARFGRWIFPATMLIIVVATWASVLLGDRPWQGVVEVLAGSVLAGWGAALAPTLPPRAPLHGRARGAVSCLIRAAHPACALGAD